MKKIGLIGGLAFRAGLFYYEQLVQKAQQNGVPLELVLHHADVNKVLKFVGDSNRTGLGEYLGSLSNDLFAAGADYVAITAVAPHLAVNELQDYSNGPIINILDCVTKIIGDSGLKRVAILGNRMVIDTNVFGAVAGELVIKLDSKTSQKVHDTYNNIALNGKRGTQPEKDYFENLSNDLIDRHKLESVILAGTDLSSFYADEPPKYPFIDVASLHIDQIMRVLVSGEADR